MKVLAVLLALWALPSAAEIRVDGGTLIYSAPTSYTKGQPSDADAIGLLLRGNPAIHSIALNGHYWITSYALDVARVVADAGLDTEARGQCGEGCLYILVAGKNRTLARGGQLKLKRIMMPTDVLRSDFPGQKANYGWADEFGQASLMYDRAQNDMRDALEFLLDHGVKLDFALRVFDTPRQDVWTPTREELVSGGVIGKD